MGWLFGSIAAAIVLSIWLRRRDRAGYPSQMSEGEETHPEPGIYVRRLEVPPSKPFD